MLGSVASILSILLPIYVVHALATRVDNLLWRAFARVVRPLRVRVHILLRVGTVWDFARVLGVFRLEVLLLTSHAHFFDERFGEEWAEKFGKRANFFRRGTLERGLECFGDVCWVSFREDIA